MVEWLGPGLTLTITPETLASRRIYALAYDKDFALADLTSSRAVGFGVTNQLSTMTPYDVPQACANALSEVSGRGFLGRAFEGIAYWSRYNPDHEALSLALFDLAGEHAEYPNEGFVSCTEPEFVDALRGRGVTIAAAPKLRQLDVIV